MRRAYQIVGWGLILLGAIHMFATTRLFSELSSGAIWFFGAGIAMALAGSLNLLNERYGSSAPGVGRVCLAANLIMTVFAVVAGIGTHATVAEFVIVVGLTAAASGFSLGLRVPKRLGQPLSSRTPV